jgi:hypothetical protein
MAYLDGRILPHGYVVFTPVGFVGAGPVVGRVINSTANVPIGQFTVPATQGPTPGRYRVEVHQNANRWLSNSFTSSAKGAYVRGLTVSSTMGAGIKVDPAEAMTLKA